MTRPPAPPAPRAAPAVDVTRQTGRAWLTHHAGFQVALHSRRQELWHARTETLRGRRPTALGALTRARGGETLASGRAGAEGLRAVWRASAPGTHRTGRRGVC